jgi:hypothetical protein
MTWVIFSFAIGIKSGEFQRSELKVTGPRFPRDFVLLSDGVIRRNLRKVKNVDLDKANLAAL